jgi:hypothetical protein
MRPLFEKEVSSFLERFDFFKDSEFRNVEILSPATIKITLAAQDSARGFDWISLNLEFSGISDARLLENSKLPHVDMDDGISIIYTDSMFAFGVGTYSNLSNIKNSTCYITSSSLKYSEGPF